MTLEEMQKVLRVISTADGGCNSCVDALVTEMAKAFPDFVFHTTTGKWSRVTDFSDNPDDPYTEEFVVINARLEN